MTIAHIDETRLETDTGYRFGYLAEFIGFGSKSNRNRNQVLHMLLAVEAVKNAVQKFEEGEVNLTDTWLPSTVRCL